MASSLYVLILTRLLFLVSCYCKQPLCHDDERWALLQFKQSFSIDKKASYDHSAYQRSWETRGERSDCCLWDGVECDHYTGHVIGLDLHSSFLRGSINSTSTLFSLVHLQTLNLAYNHFNHSQIPSKIGNLSRLTSLNLSFSVFSGQIPTEILGLSKLASLDLSRNGLYGEFPSGVFLLPNLKFVDVSYNDNLTGYLPDFHQSSPLKELTLAHTNFYGKLPYSIGNLNSLRVLDLHECHFSGFLPASLNNLTQLNYLHFFSNNFNGQVPSLTSLSQLSYFSLSYNNLTGANMSWLGNLTKLNTLHLRETNLDGVIPSYLKNLTQLNVIDLRSNNLSGRIPFWLMNLTQLTWIDLSCNELRGPIPSSLSQLQNLNILDLGSNYLSGTVEANVFLSLKRLAALQLSYNMLSLITTNTTNTTLPKFKFLGLSSCNLREIPDFLQIQDELKALSLDHNKIHGKLAGWLGNKTKESLMSMWPSSNFLTGFEQYPVVLPWPRLRILDLSFNSLQGSLPIPPPNTLHYRVSNNSLTGTIPPLICYMSSLKTLDLSNNNMGGSIPPCLGMLGNSLSVLNLKGNKFRGNIPQTCIKGSNLRMMDLSQNQLEGQVPRSLANCTMLEIFNLGENQIKDTFPIWLGALSELQVLVLRSNKFHGEIKSPTVNIQFPKLRIIDLSNNRFTGYMPVEYFQNWNAMKMADEHSVAYMKEVITSVVATDVVYERLEYYSVTINNKGVELVYDKILNIFAGIDLSGNKFKGGIPESIGSLKMLKFLNLSRNDISGHIPPSLGNLTELESLDLSQNRLSGEIPQQLAQVTGLSLFDVSLNHLTGPIPRGKQFDTFQNKSYVGNSALCGDPLSNKCGNPKVLTQISTLTTNLGDGFDIPCVMDWMIVVMGLGTGLVVGLIIGQSVTTRNHEWFLKSFGKREKQMRHKKRMGQ